jgi:hypothetical protein
MLCAVLLAELLIGEGVIGNEENNKPESILGDVITCGFCPG